MRRPTTERLCSISEPVFVFRHSVLVAVSVSVSVYFFSIFPIVNRVFYAKNNTKNMVYFNFSFVSIMIVASSMFGRVLTTTYGMSFVIAI